MYDSATRSRRAAVCTVCRKSHAAAFNSAARVERSRFRWISGEDKLTAFEYYGLLLVALIVLIILVSSIVASFSKYPF